MNIYIRASELLEYSSEIQNYSFSHFHYSCAGNLALKWSSKRKSGLALPWGGIRPPSLNNHVYNRICPYHSALSPPNNRDKGKLPSYNLPESEKRKETLLTLWSLLMTFLQQPYYHRVRLGTAVQATVLKPKAVRFWHERSGRSEYLSLQLILEIFGWLNAA